MNQTARDAGELHVIFGTGPVGRALMAQLTDMGKRVRMVNRSGRGDLPESVTVISGDAADPDFARQAAEGASVIYQALNPTYHLHATLFPPLQAAVLAAAAHVGAVLVSMENLYMYGPTHGKPMTEDTPYNSPSAKGQARARMTEELLAAHRSGHVRTVSARAADFFGPGVTNSHLGERVFPQALAGKPAQVLGDLDARHTMTYVPDVARAMIVLGQTESAWGQAWHVPSPPTQTVRQIITRVYKLAGAEPKIQRLPTWTARLVGLFNPTIRAVLEEIYQFEDDFVMDHSKFAAAFGDISTPLDQALTTTLDWYRNHFPPSA